MKKALFILCLAAIAMVAMYGTSFAAVGGTCVGCHTMHNSQGGVTMNGQATPIGNLLRGSCVYCHTGNAITAAPQVDGTNNATEQTAGGDFYGDSTNDTTIHNVDLINAILASLGADGVLANNPPGGSALTAQLGCAGTDGCHGNPSGTHNDITGFHHNTSAPYRFLYASTDMSVGVNGKGSETYEDGGATDVDHNIYDADGTNSISAFCAKCHGTFHGPANTNAASPFVRHPTDEEADISNVVAASFTPDNTQLDETPFGFTDGNIGGMSTNDMTTGTAYTTANGFATCVSCHRAHGTDQADLLRFDYSTMDAGNSTDNGGCETCHVGQQ